MSRTRSFIYGFIAGGVASATVTLLTTPQSGEDLRHDLIEKGQKWQSLADDLLQDALRLKEQITQTSKEGIELITSITEELTTSIDQWKMAIEPHQESIYNYLEQVEESLKDLEEKIQTE